MLCFGTAGLRYCCILYLLRFIFILFRARRVLLLLRPPFSTKRWWRNFILNCHFGGKRYARFHCVLYLLCFVWLLVGFCYCCVLYLLCFVTVATTIFKWWWRHFMLNSHFGRKPFTCFHYVSYLLCFVSLLLGLGCVMTAFWCKLPSSSKTSYPFPLCFLSVVFPYCSVSLLLCFVPCFLSWLLGFVPMVLCCHCNHQNRQTKRNMYTKKAR